MRVGKRGAWLLLSVVGCASSPSTVQQVLEVQCKNWSNQCYYKAQEKCGSRYTVLSTVESEETGGPYGRFRKYTVRYQCQK